MNRQGLEKILPAKEVINACQCERAMLSWEKFTNRLICHNCEKVFSERDRAIDDCLSALSKAELGVVPSVEGMKKSIRMEMLSHGERELTNDVCLEYVVNTIRSLMTGGE